MFTRLRSRLPIEDALAGVGLVWSLQRFLRRPIGPDQARGTLRRRFERREAAFLALARRRIYASPRSPYRELLGLAGCEYGDLELLVRREGLEGALAALFRRGVYLTVDELKGRKPAVRGSAAVAVASGQLVNPSSAARVPLQTSGSRGPRPVVPMDLAYIRALAVNRLLIDTARGAADWIRAIWTVPGGTALYFFLGYGAYGVYPARWFLRVDPEAPGLAPRYGWSGPALRVVGLLAGVRLPRPEHVPLDAPLPIARWMAACLAAGRTPQLDTSASAAARLCLAASGAGISLAGARFRLSAEPVTETLLATIRGSGADAVSVYASMDAGVLGSGCLRGDAPDDLHLMTDLFGLIQPGPGGRGSELPPTALLVTALHPAAPFVLLNASLGDRAELLARACGCPLERLGWTTHLHTVRSFEKLTAGGMTFLDTDVIRVLEEGLPARFGGGLKDYQLLEEEGADGTLRVRLLVHPSVGPLDPEVVADAFLTMIGGGSGVGRIMGLQWRQAGLLRVERRPPLATASGKIHHVHRARPHAAASD